MMMAGQTREVRFHDLDRKGMISRRSGGVNSHPAAKSPTFNRDSEADAPSHIPPMQSPKLRRSITPEEHENLVEQQLLQWRQQSRKREHDQSSSDQGPFEARHLSISSKALASLPSRVPPTSCCSTDSPSTSSKLSSEHLSSEVFHQVSVGSCRPRRIMTMVTGKATPVMRCTASVRQEEARDSEPEKTRCAVSDPPSKGNIKAKQSNAPRPPVVSTDNACPTNVCDPPQHVIVKNDVGRSCLGGSHKSGGSNRGAGGAPVPPEQPRPVKKVRFQCDPETEKRRNGPPTKRQRLVSVPLQVIRAQLELHSSLQNQVDRLQYDMHQQRLEQRHINASLLHCIKELERKNTELSKVIRDQRQ